MLPDYLLLPMICFLCVAIHMETYIPAIPAPVWVAILVVFCFLVNAKGINSTARVDSHIHPGMLSKSAWHVKGPFTEDTEEWLSFVKEYAEKHPKEEVPFLYFEYYPTSMFDEHGPRKEMLDKAVSDRPCLCQDFGEHLHWVNSKMLELMEVDKDTPDPSTLEIFVRDEKGEPTGWVKEFAWSHFADTLFKNLEWQPPEELTVKNLTPFFHF